MVANTSATQTAENERRMRKNTLDKVKANHLSRQLQMRLQYARLKVEHGWQKQSLNEVENLYFHSSHLRGPKSLPTPATVTVQHPIPEPAQSSLSFRVGPTNLGRTSTAEHSSPTANNNDAQEPLAANQPPKTESMDVDRPTVVASQSISMETTEKALSMLLQMSALISPVPGTTNGVEDNQPVPQDTQPLTETSAPSNQYPLTKPHMNKAPSSSRAIHTSSLTARDMVNFRLGGSLTYDSFWSSHTVPTVPGRLLRETLNGTSASADFSPVLQTPIFQSHTPLNSANLSSPQSSSTGNMPNETLPITVPP
ncbi:hypothetical protein D9619_010507 [Psilocybe cf. subviscida]|uniref:Uncharacterized protein n=1 Tax=Psilocybe cf. subviscida TaxID=2480587 RepID=A0A8H5ASP2_9AGAR|nr:hypothetical protein D9619_010507 [Psilocybe cf. subviscida]